MKWQKGIIDRHGRLSIQADDGGPLFGRDDNKKQDDINKQILLAAPELLAVCERIAEIGCASKDGFDSASKLTNADDLAQELIDAINKANSE